MKLLVLDSVDSTNAEALRQIASGQWSGNDGPLGILALSQTGGRGRSGNCWQSEPGNLYFSMICQPGKPLEHWANLSLVVGICLAELCAEIAGLQVQLKWPNDVLVDGSKLAGILLEVAQSPNGQSALVVGIGVNLAHAPTLPDNPTICVRQAAVADVELSPTNWATAFSSLFVAKLKQWEEQGFAKFRHQWLERSIGMDQTLTVRLPNQQFSAIMRGIGEDGALLVQLPNGQMREVTSGEVFFGNVER